MKYIEYTVKFIEPKADKIKQIEKQLKAVLEAEFTDHVEIFDENGEVVDDTGQTAAYYSGLIRDDEPALTIKIEEYEEYGRLSAAEHQ